MKRGLLFIACFVFTLAVYAAKADVLANAPQRYVVQKGDTLWDIAARYLRKPWQWRELWHANPAIKNPDLIFPGDVLELYQYNGRPALHRVSRGVVKLSPTVKISSVSETAIPVIPYSEIKPFLQGVQVISKPEFDDSAYIVGVADSRVVALDHEHIFVRNLHWPSRKYFSIFRLGEELQDPETKAILGVEAVNVGEARLIHAGDPATLQVMRVYQEIMPKNRLLPMPPRMSPADFYPRAPAKKIRGRIISLLNGGMVVSQHQAVIINRGAEDGLRRGDVLAIYQEGAKVQDPVMAQQKRNAKNAWVKLPDERVGTLIIFRVFKQVSFGLVMDATKPVKKLDKVSNPR